MEEWASSPAQAPQVGHTMCIHWAHTHGGHDFWDLEKKWDFEKLSHLEKVGDFEKFPHLEKVGDLEKISLSTNRPNHHGGMGL